MMMMESATPAGFARPRPLSRPRVLRNPRNRHKMIFGKQGKEKDKRDKGDIKDSADGGDAMVFVSCVFRRYKFD